MEHYLLNSAACLAILLLFYKLILEKEQMHHIKRAYLLLSVFASISIPLITMTNFADAETLLISNAASNSINISDEVIASEFNWKIILWTIYGIGVLFFSIRFILNLNSMFWRIRKNKKLKNDQFVTVLLKSNITPHTFFRYLFFNRSSYEQHLIPSEVIMHEQAHAKELHSLDILFIEILQIIFWFNPLIYLTKNAVKLNHEFLADLAVIQNGYNTTTYQKTLLAFSSNAEASNLANAFNYSSIKKRFTVMKTHTSKKMILVKTIMVIPLLAFLLFSFSTKEEISKEVIVQSEFSQDIATEKMVKEYNKLAKKFNQLPEEKRTITREELGRMIYIFDRMNKEQRERSEKFPKIIIPENAPPPPKPTLDDNLEGVIPPPPPPTTDYDLSANPENEMLAPPPPPPPPVPPVAWIYMQEISEKGAVFYLEGKEISAKEAVEIVKKNKEINVQVRNNNSEKPIVKLSKNPITVD